MDSEAKKDWEDLGGNSCAGLPQGTYIPCGVAPQTAIMRIKNSDLMAAAVLLGSESVQTAKIFCWATGILTCAEVTPEAIQRFSEVMVKVGSRFGTHDAHFDLDVETVIADAVKNCSSPRDRTTIARHRNRLPKIAGVELPQFDDRIGAGLLFKVTGDEISNIGAWAKHWGFLLVERHGRIQHGIILDTVDCMMNPGASAESLAPVLIREAKQKIITVSEFGRAFVATRHEGIFRIIPGFWRED